MRYLKAVLAAALVAASVTPAIGAAARKDYPVTPVPVGQVKVTGGFLAERIGVSRTVTIPYSLAKCEETGRIKNFAVAGGLEQGQHQGAGFNDSDLAKILEGAAYSLAIGRDPKFQRYIDDIIRKIVAAQEPDGYLYTQAKRGYLERRWVDIGGSHELYNVGHMYEAAAAYYQATGKRALLDAMVRNADLVCSVFNEQGNQQPDGHEEVELALVKLYRATGNEKYLRQAKFFLDMRGRQGRRGARGPSPMYGTYGQDHKPVIEQDEALGHAVRGAYLYCGMADVAALTGDRQYTRAVDRLWENVVGKQMYITGGIGSSWAWGEAFGGNYDLPNLTAYAETCGAIANGLWNYRMFLLHGDGKYIDVLERVVYNGALGGVSLDGKGFYYTNPPGSMRGNERQPWFDCACCPANIARFVPSIPGCACATKGNTVYVNLYLSGEAAVKTSAGWVRIKQETRYPWDGTVKMTVTPQRPGKFTVRVRIPGWAQNRPVPSDLYTYVDKAAQKPTLKVNGKPVGIKLVQNYAVLERTWKRGDRIELYLPMPVRKVAANPNVKADGGRVALERGPIVYCVEGLDVPDGRLFSLLIPDSAPLTAEFRKDLLGGVSVVRGKVPECSRSEDGKSLVKAEKEIAAIPCFAAANRGRTPMVIWLARDESAVQPIPAPTIANRATVTASRGRGQTWAFNDQIIPNGLGDDSKPSYTWWPRGGAPEWVQYDFAKEETVSKVKVYWFDDEPLGGVRVPESWRVVYWDGSEWKPVVNQGPYGTEKERLVEVAFDLVKTMGLRLEIQSKGSASSGLWEWAVE